MSSSLSDEKLLSVLKECDQYQQKQYELGIHLSKAFFRLLQARKHKNSINTIENIREDIEPTTTIEILLPSSASSAVASPVVEGFYRKNEEDIYMICGFPPQHLRSAQVEFRASLEKILELAGSAMLINHEVDEIKEINASITEEVTPSD